MSKGKSLDSAPVAVVVIVVDEEPNDTELLLKELTPSEKNILIQIFDQKLMDLG